VSDPNLGKTVCFDYSHNNTLVLESPSNADFVQYLFGSSFRLGKIQAGFTSLEKLQNYRLVVIGGPRESVFTTEEIENLIEYVRLGGNLLVINDEGGDYSSGANLNDLTKLFGFEYNSDIMHDSMSFQGVQSRIIVTDFEPHPVTKAVDSILQSKACSIFIDELIEADPDIKVTPLAKTGFNSYHNRWNGEEWVEEEDAPRATLAVAVNFHKGRVIGLSTVSMFSSLSSSYGYYAHKNETFIANIFNWLLEDVDKGGAGRNEILLNVGVNVNLFAWMEKLINDKEWTNVKDIVNFALKYFKDNYDDVIKYAEKRRERLNKERLRQLEELSKIDSKDEREQKAKILASEQSILDMHASDTAKDLEDIMASLRDLTGGAVGKGFDPRFNGNTKEEKQNTEELEEKKSTESNVESLNLENKINEEEIKKPAAEVKKEEIKEEQLLYSEKNNADFLESLQTEIPPIPKPEKDKVEIKESKKHTEKVSEDELFD
jgi:hypothetical protein